MLSGMVIVSIIKCVRFFKTSLLVPSILKKIYISITMYLFIVSVELNLKIAPGHKRVFWFFNTEIGEYNVTSPYPEKQSLIAE